jgi:hypothetical protein
MSEIADPSSITTTVLVDKPKTVTANYVHQFLINFEENGLTGDALSAVIVVNGTPISFSSMPYGIWVDTGGIVTYSYQSTVTSSVSGKQFRFTGVAGPSSPITVTEDVNLTGNYLTQYYLTITTSYGTAGGQGWYDYGATAYASVNTGFVNHGNMTGHLFTNWNGDASGTNYVQSNGVMMNAARNAVAKWKTQYYLALTTNPGETTSPTGEGWYDANTLATISTVGYVDVTPGSSRYRFNGWTTVDTPEIADPTVSPTTVLVDKGKTVTAQYVLQYKITFSTNAGSEFTGTPLAVDDHDYLSTELPIHLWLDSETSHTFVFQSPLTVSSSKRYIWTSTSGLSTSQGGTIEITAFGDVSASYKIQYYVTVNSPYGSPVAGSTWIDSGGSLTESIVSPVAGSTGTRYVCIGYTGTGSAPPTGTGTSTTFTVTQLSTVTWVWKTQYYLAVTTQPPGTVVIPGEGWYDSGSLVSLSAPEVGGFAFDNWNVNGVSQGVGVIGISVTLSEPRTATAHYTMTTAFNVQINPTDITIHEGQTVLFTSTVNGGTTPLQYQWVLDSHNVTGATSNSWQFLPTGLGTYYVRIVVADSHGLVAQSANARVIVISASVGGYSVSPAKHMSLVNVAAYAVLVFAFAAVLSLTKRKRK